MTRVVTSQGTQPLRPDIKVIDTGIGHVPGPSMHRPGALPLLPAQPKEAGAFKPLNLIDIGMSPVALRASRFLTLPPKLEELAPALPAEVLRLAHAADIAAHPVTDPTQLAFHGVEGQSVYNPTAPFVIDGMRVIAARVEDPHDELASNVMFFTETGHEEWTLIPHAPVFAMQDPCVTTINGETVLGGVETYPRVAPKTGTGYRQVFFKGDTFAELAAAAATMTPFAKGPDDMKDVRLLELADGSIFVLLRPQGTSAGNAENAGLGKISWGIIPNIDALADPKTIARLVQGQQLDQFIDAEWGGANEMHLLPDGKIGVLGHIAKWNDEHTTRHYYVCTFTIDPKSGEVSPMEIILERHDLDPTESGGAFKPELWDVLFSGGIILHDDGTATVYVGAGDKECLCARIRNPYLPRVDEPKSLLSSTTLPRIEFTSEKPEGSAHILKMNGTPAGFMATNPSAPVLVNGRIFMAVREQQDHVDPGYPKPGPSQVALYAGDNTSFTSFTRVKTLVGAPKGTWIEDPALVRLNGQLYVSCVRVEFAPKQDAEGNRAYTYTTEVHTMDDNGNVSAQPVAAGPINMKDLRLVALPDGGIGVLTRPKNKSGGGDYGNGYIGFTRIDSVEQLNPQVVLDAQPLLRPEDIVKAIPELEHYLPHDGNGSKGVWVGANDAVANPDGSMTVYGHFGTEGPYGMMRFDFDPATRAVSNVQLVAESHDFAGLKDGHIRPDTVFTGGVFAHDGDLFVSCGLNDCQAGGRWISGEA